MTIRMSAMRTRPWRLLVLAALVLLGSATAADAKRVALVIGNAKYVHTSELRNPVNDANDVAAVLRRLGFRVLAGADLDKAGMDRLIRDFAEALLGAEVGLFFYAGHGLQVGQANYLVPVDARLTSAAGLDFELVRLDLIQRQMEREAGTNLLFLDACRNNPLARNLARAMGTRSAEIGRGLASAESGVGTLISFATQPGNVALDGDGRNSPYTAALVKHLAVPGRDLSATLIAVRNEVRAATERRQVPWENSALTAPFYFAESLASASTAVSEAAPARPSAAYGSEASRAWEAIKDSKNAALLKTFIERFGDSFYAEVAKARLAELAKEQAALTVPAEPKVRTAPEPKSEAGQCVVNDPTGTPLNVRKTPNGDATGIRLSNGTAVRLVSTALDARGRQWAYVAAGDGRKNLGYVFKSFLNCDANR